MNPFSPDLNGDGALEKFGNERGDRRALASRQGDVSKKRMTLQGFHHCNDSVMATHPKVVALGNIVGHDHSRALADA